jgi:predicted nucleic acid-binding protein
MPLSACFATTTKKMADLQYFYWDACPFCAVFNKEDGRVEKCRQVLKAAESKELKIVTSALTVAEVVRVKDMERIPRGKETTLHDFFQHEFIVIVSVDWFIATRARQLIYDYPALKPMDAIHLATAIKAKVFEMHSYDGGLLGLSEKAGMPTLPIRQPSIPEPPLLSN